MELKTRLAVKVMPASAGNGWRMTLSHPSNCKWVNASSIAIECHLFALSFIRLGNSFHVLKGSCATRGSSGTDGVPSGDHPGTGWRASLFSIGNGGSCNEQQQQAYLESTCHG